MPVEAQIHKKALQLFNNITNQSEESIEKRLARRQLAVKLNPSASWFIEIKKLLLQYELQDLIFMLDNPITKNEWKSILNRKINVYWWNNIKHSTTLYKSLQFLNTEKC